MNVNEIATKTDLDTLGREICDALGLTLLRCPDFLTLDQVASMVGRTTETVRKWAADGLIEVVRTEHGRRVHRDEASRIIAQKGKLK